jgi:hypothetical protein
MTFYLQKVHLYFVCQNLLSETAKSDQDPDPHGSGLVWLLEKFLLFYDFFMTFFYL